MGHRGKVFGRSSATLRRAAGWPGAPGDVLDKLATLVPREMRRALMAAFGNARLASRGLLQVDDLPRGAAGKGRIGFMQ